LNSDDLDLAYTALSDALGRAGSDKSALLLATLCLAMLAREPEAERALDLIAQAERLALR
jgi:hypothetical protein